MPMPLPWKWSVIPVNVVVVKLLGESTVTDLLSGRSFGGGIIWPVLLNVELAKKALKPTMVLWLV